AALERDVLTLARLARRRREGATTAHFASARALRADEQGRAETLDQLSAVAAEHLHRRLVDLHHATMRIEKQHAFFQRVQKHLERCNHSQRIRSPASKCSA